MNDLEFTMKTPSVVEIESNSMKVRLYKDFPAVRQYVLGGTLEGEVVTGSLKAPCVIRLNGKDVVLEKNRVTCAAAGNKAVYSLAIPREENTAKCEIQVEISLEGYILTMEIPDVVYKERRTAENAITSIGFPGQSLVSVSSGENGEFAGSSMSSHTMISGDTFLKVADMETGSKDYMYGILSNGKISASMESNSEATGNVIYNYGIKGGSDNARLTVTTTQPSTGEKVTGIGSGVFYWNRVVRSKAGSGNPDDLKDYITDPTEKPLIKVILTGDRNGDGMVDWQDGAAAFREISHKVYKSQEVPDLVAMRIVENFSSQATNPFLMTLDNAKRVCLNTDGLGQSVLLKGYASEGHDSGHPDYYAFNKRAGGVVDFRTMIDKGEDMGARFGIHVNASELYPEAKSFDEDLVRRNDGELSYGWNWLDQAVGMDGLFDLVSGRRAARFHKLHEELGGDGADKLDFIYVDVWGGSIGDGEDSWTTRRLTDEITGNGWRMATEWGMSNEYDSTFQHWAVDLAYGNQASKGYNSVIARFIRNQQKDSWVADYPVEFGGAANAPLLGGYNQVDFEGWYGRNDYFSYITNLFTYDLSTKFLQHFLVSQWELDPFNAAALKDGDGNTHSWLPDKMVAMEGGHGKITITRKSTNYDTGVDSDYRYRTILLNGKKILWGHLSQADTGKKGDETYLIPWYWDADGGELVAEDEKLYHWNTRGGETAWDLPDSWSGLNSVYVYRLTGEGRTDRKEIPVNAGRIRLHAKEETPYVVYKREAALFQMSWQGSHLVDTGFNSGNLDEWRIRGDARIHMTSYGNPVLRMAGGSSASQIITDLVPDQDYALYLALDNQSDSDFIMTVTGKGGKLGTNRAGRSMAANYVATDPHNANYGMEAETTGNTQYMYVYFTADDTAGVLHLSRISGDGYTYIDNLRIVENEAKAITFDENGDMISFTQDFENVVQGIWPFVMGNATGVSDTRVHLSQLHAPYTQAGWDVKKGDDALFGSWSLKANGQTGLGRFLYQTIPQNLFFKPECVYKVSFDYEVGSGGTYGVVIGDGASFCAEDIMLLPYKADEDGCFVKQRFDFEIKGAADGQTWFGLYSTLTPADTQGVTQNDVINFSGYKDLILDNLKVVKKDTEPSR